MGPVARPLNLDLEGSKIIVLDQGHQYLSLHSNYRLEDVSRLGYSAGLSSVSFLFLLFCISSYVVKRLPV